VPRPYAAFACLCLAAGALTLWAYLPGLHGDFLFDDYANLPALGAQGPVVSWSVFWRYITSGQADPTGRPLALLSFLLDAHDWPAPAYSFKRTNLVIHLLNGALLGALLYQLGRDVLTKYKPDDARTRLRLAIAAALGTAFWLLHPLFVSTTLYIVQREAMLPVTFTLLGLLLWLGGRRRLWRGSTGQGLAWMAAGLVGCTGLAVLGKANGILLPSLALVVEYTLLRPIDTDLSGLQPGHAHAQRLNRRALAVLAWPIAAIVAGYLAYEGWHGWHGGISAVRPWTLQQRLLTEPRVLLEYLKLLWVPRPFTPGVFNDQVQASRSLLEPLSTLLALLGLSALVVAAWRLRRRWPTFALAVFFYLVGQALESSTVALELFFEHRNYLPSLLMFWPLALWLCGVAIRLPAKDQSADQTYAIHTVASSRHDCAKAILTAVLLAGLVLMTHARSALWGNSRDQALLWATLNPASPRAQAYAAQAEMAAGNPQAAARRLQEALVHAPGDMQLALNLLAARCQAGHLDATTLDKASHALATSRDTGALLANWFQRVIAKAPRSACPELTASAIEQLLKAARTNSFLTQVPGRRQDLYSLQGQLDLASGDATGALEWFNRALDQQVRVDVALQQAAQLGSTGHPELGLAHLSHYEAARAWAARSGTGYRPPFGMARLHVRVLEWQGYWEQELDRLRATLLEDARNKQVTTG
jgi:tetratricopeptide (TPR) repeat protein